MTLKRLKIIALSDNPNIDCIKIKTPKWINIISVNIGTGDDFIVMLSCIRNVWDSDIICGPSHGIHVGSLEKYEGEHDLDDIVVKNCTFSGTIVNC